jgi:glycosyltransferase involved in cell wall biosynthesis
MRIGLFLANAGRNAGGPETYEIELLRNLVALNGHHEYHVLCFSEAARRKLGVERDNVHYHVLWPPLRPLSMLTALPWNLWRLRPDVVHATFVPPPVSPSEYLFTLVCMSPFLHPEHYPPAIRWRLQKLLTRGVRRARRILCVSENVRDLAREYFALPDDRLAVVHMGASQSFRPLDPRECRPHLQRLGVEGRYFLYSGRWERRKNLLGILEAFALFRNETRSDVQLALTGQRTWLAREANERIDRLGIRGAVLDLGKTPFEELPYLYASAQALVFASLWEGFGMPIVEAMAAGTPVITSNLSSMPEVAGDAALLVNPHSPQDIAEAMHRISADSRLRSTLRSRGLERARLFTWERTAQGTLAAYCAVSGRY